MQKFMGNRMVLLVLCYVLYFRRYQQKTDEWRTKGRIFYGELHAPYAQGTNDNKTEQGVSDVEFGVECDGIIRLLLCVELGEILMKNGRRVC